GAHAEPQLRDRPHLPGAPGRPQPRLQRAQHAGPSAARRAVARAGGPRPLVHRLERSNRHAALGEKVKFTFVGGGEGAMTRGEMLQHLVNHTSYHRGFVAQMMYEVPARPPTTDLTVFLRDVHRPLAP